ncbi:E3 ubiquitin-protein ligase ATL31 [Bienertia sinuspersici]
MVGLGFKPTINPVECSICLGFFEGDDKVRLLPKCGHVFHVDCLNPWFMGHSTCPLCRANLVPQPDDMNVVESGQVVGLGHSPREVNADANDVVQARQEIGGIQSKKIWRWNSTGHVAKFERMKDKEKSTEELKDSSTTRRELNRSNSCIIIKVGGETWVDPHGNHITHVH